MHMLPPKKRKENRRSQEQEPQSSDETSSYTSESSPQQEGTGSPSSISTSPIRKQSPPSSLPSTPSLLPFPQSVPMRTIVDSPPPAALSVSPPLSTRIKDEPEEILEVDDLNRNREVDSGVEDIKTEDDHSGHSDEDIGIKINRLDINRMDQHQAIELANLRHMMALQSLQLHQQAQRVCRPIANRVASMGTFPLILPPPFFSQPFGFSPYQRVLLPTPTIHQPLPPSSPPPLAPSQTFSHRLIQGSPPQAKTIQDGNSSSRRQTRIDDSYFQSDPGKRQKDEKLATLLGLTGDEVDQLVCMPMDEFQDYCHQKNYNEEQMNQLRDIRRRGKNKVAAQNCRKRKIDQIEELQGSVEEVTREKQKNEKILKENLLVRDKLVDSFWECKKDLEDHNQEYLRCSEHPVLTKACLGQACCEITIKLIRS